MYPSVISKISNLWIMGGNHLGKGNATRCAEFNFYFDPEAAFIVFEESACDIYLFPWEPCLEAAQSLPMEWRTKVLAGNGNKFTALLDPVEIKAFRNYFTNWIPCDNFLACAFILPRMIEKSEMHHVTVELGGNFTRGQMVIDHLEKNKKNTFIIEKLDMDLFKKLMLWVCGHDIDLEF